MTSISHKPITTRSATAMGVIRFTNPETHRLLQAGEIQKGDVFSAARIAGIMAAKRTADVVPLCHPGIGVTGVEVDIQLHPPEREGVEGAKGEVEHDTGSGNNGHVEVRATVTCVGRTGVEMEAMTAVMGASLTVYDMCKAVDKGMVIGEVKLLEKLGGKSGHWRRESKKQG